MTHVMRTFGDRAYFATHERGQYEQAVAQVVRSSDQPDRIAAFDRASSPFRFAQRTSSGRPRGGTALRVGTVAPDRFASGRRAPPANSKGRSIALLPFGLQREMCQSSHALVTPCTTPCPPRSDDVDAHTGM